MPDTTPVPAERGYMLVPTADVERYVQQRLMTAAVGAFFGFTVGVAVGVVLGRHPKR